MLWLRNVNNCPPGEFYYRQAESGARVFGPSPLIATVAGEISAFRKANQLPRSDLRACVEDVITFTVARLDPNSEWVINTEQPVDTLLPNTSGGCAGCGAVVT